LADPQKEPIPVGTTDASKAVEDENPSTSLPEQIFMQEQNMNSPSAEGDLIDVDTQTINSPVQQTIDGKKNHISILSFYNNHKLKILFDVCRYQC